MKQPTIWKNDKLGYVILYEKFGITYLLMDCQDREVRVGAYDVITKASGTLFTRKSDAENVLKRWQDGEGFDPDLKFEVKRLQCVYVASDTK